MSWQANKSGERDCPNAMGLCLLKHEPRAGFVNQRSASSQYSTSSTSPRLIQQVGTVSDVGMLGMAGLLASLIAAKTKKTFFFFPAMGD